MTKDLKQKWEDAEAEAQKIMAEKDEAMAKVRERYDERLRKANARAAEAQTAFLNHEVLESLRDRSDKWAVIYTLERQGWEGGPSAEEIVAVLGDRPDG